MKVKIKHKSRDCFKKLLKILKGNRGEQKGEKKSINKDEKERKKENDSSINGK